MKVLKSVPKESILHSNSKFDYCDVYRMSLNEGVKTKSSVDLAKAFFRSSPSWMLKLFAFRNKVVKRFGLKVSEVNGDLEEILANFKGEKGEQVGIFKVYQKLDKEIILGEEDKHLDFKVSLLETQEENRSQITISTVVNYNNRFGKVYFYMVKPFHKKIVKVMLRNMVKELSCT